MPDDKAILAPLQTFADAVTDKMKALTPGEPEDQLRAPFETFMEEVGKALAIQVVCAGETRLAGRLGSDRFLSKLETALNRRLRPLPVGRPRKKRS
jgi:hypothetical protein